MKLSQIPIGHLAKSNRTYANINLITLVGNNYGICLNTALRGTCNRLECFNDDYEDLGELKVDLEEIKTVKVNLSVE